MWSSSERYLQPAAPAEPRGEALARRALRQRRRGDQRGAMLLLREAAQLCEFDPRLWALYGAQCARLGRQGDAQRALQHSAWLRDRAREPQKARATRAFAARLLAHAAA